MKKIPFLVALLLSFILEAVLCAFFISKIHNSKSDTVAINEVWQQITNNYGETDKYSQELEYVLLGNNGEILYSNRDDMAHSINEAIQNNDIMLDVIVEGEDMGTLIIRNNTEDNIRFYRRNLLITIIAILVFQLIVVLAYFIYINRTIVKPFERLDSFAVRVAEGNLDVPLDMDKKHIFGSFTEAFDLMRSELKKARIAEKKANDDKKEMVAKLSHDIKTPVASIKTTSEIGYELSKEERMKELYNQINVKSDQITTLVDNLFNSSVAEVTEISVNPVAYNSDIIPDLIKNSDYMNKAGAFGIESCTVMMDKLRLQQAFDNVFMNSYKYANTLISVESEIEEEYLVISITDEGEGVLEEELPLLKEKYKRGSNTFEKDGAGIGLFLTNYYLDNMGGKLVLMNANPGFRVKIYLQKI